MNIGKQIFMDSHGALDFSKTLTFEEIINGEGEGVVGYFPTPTPEQARQVSEFLEVDSDTLYFNPQNMIDPYFYMNEFLLVGFQGLDLDMLKLLKVKERINQGHKKMDEVWANGDYSRYFTMVDKRIRILTYVELFHKIPDEHKYDVFVDVYTSSESGFSLLLAIGDFFMNQVFEARQYSSRWQKSMSEELPQIIAEKENVVVYKGVSNPDKPVMDYSWTLNRDVAVWFAKRFNNKSGAVLVGEVDREDILDYIDARNEAEVLIKPDKVRVIRVEED